MPINQYRVFDDTVYSQFLLDFSKEWEKIKIIQKCEEIWEKIKDNKNIQLKFNERKI